MVHRIPVITAHSVWCCWHGCLVNFSPCFLSYSLLLVVFHSLVFQSFASRAQSVQINFMPCNFICVTYRLILSYDDKEKSVFNVFLCCIPQISPTFSCFSPFTVVFLFGSNEKCVVCTTFSFNLLAKNKKQPKRL